MNDLNETYKKINSFEISECSCDICKNMCKTRPCWGTPKDIKILIENGHSDRLMLDWWETENDNIYILAPAIIGHESQFAPFNPTGKCTFYKKGKCEIHNIKPIEGKTAIHDPTKHGMHELISKTWDSKEGRKLVKKWKKIIGI